AGTGGGAVADEHRDSRKIARKKSNPTLSSAPTSAEAPTPVNEGTVRHSGRMPGLSSEQQPQQSSASAPSRHRRGVQQRASSSNSADSKEDDDRLSSGSKKSKRSHHHHHRHAADSTGDSSPQTAYASTASEQTWVSTAKNMQVCYRTSLLAAVVFYEVEFTASNIRFVSTSNVTVVKFLFSMPVRNTSGGVHFISIIFHAVPRIWCLYKPISSPMPDPGYDITCAKINFRINEDFDGFALKKRLANTKNAQMAQIKSL
ncbi:hypothetical protein T265_12978, partial [Opisthorchis viverrini]